MRKYRAVDLFSGCGGISKGFFDTGRVEIVGAIDFDQAACDTFKKNFPNASVFCGDINNISVNVITKDTNDDIRPLQNFLKGWDVDR